MQSIELQQLRSQWTTMSLDSKEEWSHSQSLCSLGPVLLSDFDMLLDVYGSAFITNFFHGVTVTPSVGELDLLPASFMTACFKQDAVLALCKANEFGAYIKKNHIKEIMKLGAVGCFVLMIDEEGMKCVRGSCDEDLFVMLCNTLTLEQVKKWILWFGCDIPCEFLLMLMRDVNLCKYLRCKAKKIYEQVSIVSRVE